MKNVVCFIFLLGLAFTSSTSCALKTPATEEIALTTEAFRQTQPAFAAANATATQKYFLTIYAATFTSYALPPTPTSALPELTSTPDPCWVFKLTAEECANSGVHTYSWRLEISNEQFLGCIYPAKLPRSGEDTFVISFSRDSVQIRIEGESKVTIANKTSENTYSFPGQETTYTFSQNGFISESTPPKSCTYKYTYSFK